LLHIGVLRQIVRHNANGRRNGADLTDRPVAQNADDLVVVQWPPVDLLAGQVGKNTSVARAGRTAVRLQQAQDISRKFASDIGHGRTVLGRGGGVVLLRPQPQRLMHAGGPTEERALHPNRKWLGKISHQLQLRSPLQGAHQVGCDAAALWLEGLHGLRREIGLNDATVLAVLGGIHAVGNREISGNRAAERFGVVQDTDDVLVPKERPTQQVTVRNRATFTHGVTGGALITQHRRRLRIPVLGMYGAHDFDLSGNKTAQHSGLPASKSSSAGEGFSHACASICRASASAAGEK
jgi:hypothetical protein